MRVSRLALLPIAGVVHGIAALLAALPFAGRPGVAALVGTLVLEGAARARPSRGTVVASGAPLLGVFVLLAMFGARFASLAALDVAGRSCALVLAPLLGRWAMVVQCYGSTAVSGEDALGRVEPVAFGEFAWTSVLALGASQAVAAGVGVLLVFAVCLLVVGIRVFVHRRLGGFTGARLWATDALVETAVLGMLGGVAQLKT